MLKLEETVDGWTWWYLTAEDGTITAGPFDEEGEVDIAGGCPHGHLCATFP